VQLALRACRLLCVLVDEVGRLRVALRVRGFRNRMDWHSYRVVGAVAGTLLVRGHERAERVAHAMRCRGFDGTFRALAEFRTRAADVAGFVLLSAVAGGGGGGDLWVRGQMTRGQGDKVTRGKTARLHSSPSHPLTLAPCHPQT